MKIKINTGRKVFIVFNYVFCFGIAALCLFPVLHVLAVSMSSQVAVTSGHVVIWPVGFNLDNYRMVVRDAQFFTSYWVSFKRAVLGWAISITMTVLAAYPMAQKKVSFPARPFFVAYFMGTMLFSGGMIPAYLVVKGTGLIDTIWSLVVPGAVGTYNIILMMNFMKGLPDSLLESAFIDGATHFRTLRSIVLPLSTPSIATISLFIVLGHWNAWFDGMIYIKSADLKPLQTYLRSIVIVDSSMADSSAFLEDIIANVSRDGANGAKIFLALLPIMCVYPFVQRHFVKGIVRGSVKE